MNAELVHFIIETSAAVAAAVVIGAAGWLYRGQHDRKRIGEAPFIFVKRLDELIYRALSEGEEHALLNATAIVSARNSMINASVSIAGSLNSQIDRLAEEVGMTTLLPPRFLEHERRLRDGRMPDREAAWDTIQVLARVWPAKRSEVMIQVRKMLAELNIPVDYRREDNFSGQWRGPYEPG